MPTSMADSPAQPAPTPARAARCKDGEFAHVTIPERTQLEQQYERDCEVLDVVGPSFEAWLMTRVVDLETELGDSRELVRRAASIPDLKYDRRNSEWHKRLGRDARRILGA